MRRVTRAPSLRWIAIALLHVRAAAQRKLDKGWVQEQVPFFDVNALGIPAVNHADDGLYYIMDGQHRIALLRAVGWGDQQVQCEVSEGLSLEEEALTFLRLNKQRPVKVFAKFLVRCTGQDPVAVGIAQIVSNCGLILAESQRDGAVRAVRALEQIYSGAGLGPSAEKDGPDALRRTLKTLQGAWGNAFSSFDGSLIEGIGMIQLRYNGKVEQATLTQKLSGVSGGAPGVIGRAAPLRDMHGGTKSSCIAGLVVQLYNRGRQKNKLDDWWRG
jgi:hypothetical protein